jgi:hypothetical protein
MTASLVSDTPFNEPGAAKVLLIGAEPRQPLASPNPAPTRCRCEAAVLISNSAHSAGANGTNWRSNLEIHNPNTTMAGYTMALLKRDTDADAGSDTWRGRQSDLDSNVDLQHSLARDRYHLPDRRRPRLVRPDLGGDATDQPVR